MAVLIVVPTHHVIATIPIAFAGAIIIFDQIPKGKQALPLEAFAVASHWSYPQCWAQLSASFGSRSMAWLEKHKIKLVYLTVMREVSFTETQISNGYCNVKKTPLC